MPRSRRLPGIQLATSLIILAILAALAWYTIAQFRSAIHRVELAELRLSAVRETCNLVLDYVDQRHDWPRSWEELLSLNHWHYARDPAGWSPPLADSVTIKFDAALEDLRDDDPATFHAIVPRGGAAAVPLQPDYASFLSNLRALVPRQ